MAAPAVPPETSDAEAAASAARGRVTVGLSDGRSIWDVGRQLLAGPVPDGTPLVAVELTDDEAGSVRVTTGSPCAGVVAQDVALGHLARTVLGHAPVAVAVQLAAGPTVDSFDRTVSAWLDAGVHVALVAGDRQIRDSALIRFADLQPRVELSGSASRPGVRRLLHDLVGPTIEPHRALVEDVVAANAPLALLVATALEPWLGQQDVPRQAIEDALSIALAKHVRGLTETDEELAFAFLHVVVGACPALNVAARVLHVCPDRALELRHELIEAGLGVGASRRRTLAMTGLLRVLPPTATRDAVAALSELLVQADLDPDTCLDALATLRNEGDDRFAGLVHDTVKAVQPERRAALLTTLLPALADGSDNPVRTVVVRARRRHADALGVPIRAAATARPLSDPLQGVSLLVGWEHPDAVLAWTERVLAEPEVDARTWLRAAMAHLVAGGSGRTLRDGPAAARAAALTEPDARLLRVVQACSAALTMAAREDDILAIASEVDDLDLDDWPTDIGCLVAGSCLAVNEYDLADRWTWLVRSQTEPDSLDHGAAQLTKAFCEMSRGEFVRARENAAAAATTLAGAGADALAAVASVTATLCHSRGQRDRPEPMRADAHAMLLGVHHYLVAQITMEEDDGVDVVNVLFEIGRRLRSAGLTNPGLVKWRELLVQIFEGRDEPQIADCLRTDLSRVEERWARHNPRSATARAALAQLGPVVPTADARGLAAISASEMRVVERVVAGDTNPEAATALFLSKRTVDTHLRNVYRRLGITSRDELKELVQNASEAS